MLINVMIHCCASDIITDPKSPASIHSGFNKPTKEAILLSNTSILLEYASEEFISHLEQYLIRFDLFLF